MGLRWMIVMQRVLVEGGVQQKTARCAANQICTELKYALRAPTTKSWLQFYVEGKWKNRIPNPFVALTSTSSSNCLAASALQDCLQPYTVSPWASVRSRIPWMNCLSRFLWSTFSKEWSSQTNFESSNFDPIKRMRYIRILVAMPGCIFILEHL